MPTLSDFPENRRFALMWQYVLFPGLDRLEERVRQPGQRPCIGPRVSLPQLSAFPAHDGMFHLVRGTRLLCGEGQAERVSPHVPPGHRPKEFRLLPEASDPVAVLRSSGAWLGWSTAT